MLSSQKQPKDLPDWLELDYFERPSRFTRWKSKVLTISWVGGLIAGVILVIFPFTNLPQPRAAFTSGSSSRAHAMFIDDCRLCHQEGFQTAARLVRHDDTLRS